MFDNVIFDWSGVIKDVSESHLWVVNRMLKKMGHEEISFTEMMANWDEPYMLFWKKYFPDLSVEKEIELYKEAIWHPDCPKNKSCEDMPEFVKKLKNCKSFMAIVSFDLPDTLIPEISEFGLSGVFSEVITHVSDKGVALKELIAKRKLNISKTIFIGDGNHEMIAARQLGIRTAAVTWGLCTEEKLKSTNPDYLVHNIKELQNILL